MSIASEQFRDAVVRRAGNRCEYCQLPAQLQISGFEMALACPHCNARKWAHVDGEDPESGQRVALFNPRTQKWQDHFQWSEQHPFTIVGASACGRATVARLHMNHPDLVSIRRLLTELGLSWRAET
jgi:hypothetical protein